MRYSYFKFSVIFLSLYAQNIAVCPWKRPRPLSHRYWQSLFRIVFPPYLTPLNMYHLINLVKYTTNEFLSLTNTIQPPQLQRHCNWFHLSITNFSEKKFELVLWIWSKVHTPSKWCTKTVFLRLVIYFRPSTKSAYVKWHGCLTSIINWSPGERRRASQRWNHAAS